MYLLFLSGSTTEGHFIYFFNDLVKYSKYGSFDFSNGQKCKKNKFFFSHQNPSYS